MQIQVHNMPQPWLAADGRENVAIAPAPKPAKRASSNDFRDSVESSSTSAAAASANSFKPEDAVMNNSSIHPVIEVERLSASSSVNRCLLEFIVIIYFIVIFHLRLTVLLPTYVHTRLALLLRLIEHSRIPLATIEHLQPGHPFDKYKSRSLL